MKKITESDWSKFCAKWGESQARDITDFPKASGLSEDEEQQAAAYRALASLERDGTMSFFRAHKPRRK